MTHFSGSHAGGAACFACGEEGMLGKGCVRGEDGGWAVGQHGGDG